MTTRLKTMMGNWSCSETFESRSLTFDFRSLEVRDLSTLHVSPTVVLCILSSDDSTRHTPASRQDLGQDPNQDEGPETGRAWTVPEERIGKGKERRCKRRVPLKDFMKTFVCERRKV